MTKTRSFRNAPIKRKLLVIIVFTSAAALLLAGIATVLVDSVIFRRDLRRDLTALAQIAGDNSTAALTFNDPAVADEVLGALKARPHMVGACLYQEDGSIFAAYVRPGSGFGCPSSEREEKVESTSQGLTLWHPIFLQGHRVGTLFMLYDLAEVPERIWLYSGIIAAILLVSIILALVLSSSLRSLIAVPVARLASAAHTVSESGDYSIRVRKESNDELGLLVDAFNRMLAGIQTRDAEVQNARNSLAITLASIGDAVVSTDAQGRIVFSNPVAQALLRWPEADLAGKPIGKVFRIVNEHTRQPVESPVDRVLREGTITGLANHTILIARDGTEVPIDDSAAPIVQNGRTTGVVLVFRDITERQRAQQDAAYLAAIVESTDDAVIGKNTDGIIQSWNRGAERVYGYTAQEAIGRPMLELVPADRAHEESDILEQLREGKLIVHFETVRVRKDGTSIDVSLTISPIRDRYGRVVGISHLARDITEQKRTAEQIRHTQKLESLGVLAGGIAHDFNNLLTGILGNASLATEDLPPGSAARPALDAVIAASERAAQLAQQMLAYSGKGRFVLEQIDLSERVRDTLPLIRASIPPNVDLRLKLGDSLPRVEADPGQMQQVLMNIIINGAEAIPEGKPGAVTVTTRKMEVGEGDGYELAPGTYVCFEVADTGIGMDEETQARIFDPFFTTKFTGRGLGLAAVMGIVRGHHGAIKVTSAVGHGATFRILLPAADENVPEQAPEAAPAQNAEAAESGLILVVDDEQVIRNIAKLALERHGYSVLLAEDGARGLDVFRRESHRIKCVILDLTMPVMSGEETLTQMKALDPEIPVILSSGFNEAQAVRRFEGKGLAAFLQKPYKADGLLEKVRGVLANHSSNHRDTEKIQESTEKH